MRMGIIESENPGKVPLPVCKYRKGMTGIFEHVPGLNEVSEEPFNVCSRIRGGNICETASVLLI